MDDALRRHLPDEVAIRHDVNGAVRAHGDRATDSAESGGRGRALVAAVALQKPGRRRHADDGLQGTVREDLPNAVKPHEHQIPIRGLQHRKAAVVARGIGRLSIDRHLGGVETLGCARRARNAGGESSRNRIHDERVDRRCGELFSGAQIDCLS